MSELVLWKKKEEIEKKVREIVKEVERDFPEGDLYLIGVLRSAFVFMSDFIRMFSEDRNLYCYFMNLYYQEAMLNESKIRVVRETTIYPSFDVKDKNVVLLVGVTDTGIIIDHVLGTLRMKGTRTLKVASVIDKPVLRKVDFSPDYVCFEDDDDRYIVGYGMDYRDKYRNLPYLAKLDI